MKKTNKKNKAKASDSTEFLRLVQRFSRINSWREANLLEGVSKARVLTKPDKYIGIVRELAKKSSYSNLFSPLKFPASYRDYTLTKVYINPQTDEQAMMWVACVLAEHKEKLKKFIAEKSEFEALLWHGHYDDAKTKLEAIERDFGVSLWLISRKIILLNNSLGVAEQKKYLSDVVSTPGINPLAAVTAYYISMLCEEGRSTDQLEEELAQSWENPLFKDFTICHVIPHRILEISNPATVLGYEECLPLIDRLQSFINLAQLFVARHGIDSRAHIYRALKLIEDTSDPRVLKLIALAEGRIHSEDDEFVKCLDNYTRGRYSEVESSSTDLLELLATKNAHLSMDPKSYGDGSLFCRAVATIHKLLVVPQERFENSLALRKLSLAFVGDSVPFQVAALIENDQEFVLDDDNHVLSRLAAICGRMDNPRNWRLYEEINPDFVWDHSAMNGGITGSLYNILHMDYFDGCSAIDEIDIPDYRKFAYKGHLAFRNNIIEEAISNYRLAAVADGAFVASRAKRYLFRALLKNNQLEDCVALVASHCVSSPGIEAVYPLLDLASKILDTAKLNANLSAAIILNLASRIDPDWEKPLSDYYENIMYAWGVETPSELSVGVGGVGDLELIFFLRYICVPRILDDTTAFDSPELIDGERILVCQKLIDIDPKNIKIYSAEIKTITRDSQVLKLLQQIQASNIFVDEEGLKLSIEANIKDRFSKYQELISYPEIDAQAESISKVLERMINSKAEFKALSLPATERKALFSGLLHYFVSGFAMHPVYGLDTHLSTSIRHGKFEGHLRNPIATYGLLCVKYGQVYSIPEQWVKRLGSLTNQERTDLQKALEKFTVKIEGFISEYLKKFLHVKSETAPLGMFNLYATDADREVLSQKINIEMNSDEFIDLLFDYCWELTDKSLTMIRSEIDSTLRRNINNAFDMLLGSIREKISNGKAVLLVDAVLNSRTDMELALSAIQSWFKKPIKARHEPFYIDLALDVGAKQISNCFANHQVDIVKTISCGLKFKGQYLSGMVEVIFILLQNVLIHSGFGESRNVVSVKLSQVGDLLTIEVENRLAAHIDLVERERAAKEAVSKYNQETALAMAKKEGGSGLSKIWRIVEYYFKKESSISLDVSSDRVFRVSLVLLNVGDLSC
jgi:hypothetical protein